jgi:hypothetical protein
VQVFCVDDGETVVGSLLYIVLAALYNHCSRDGRQLSFYAFPTFLKHIQGFQGSEPLYIVYGDKGPEAWRDATQVDYISKISHVFVDPSGFERKL